MDELQALCDQIAADLGCLDILETSRRQVKVRVQGVLLAILTLHWHDKADTVLVEHINCYALTEASVGSFHLFWLAFVLIPATAAPLSPTICIQAIQFDSCRFPSCYSKA